MGLFGGKKEAPKDRGDKPEKPTTARRSRRIVQPGAAKQGGGGAPGGTKARSPQQPPVKRAADNRPAANDEVLQLDDFASAPPPPPKRAGAPAPLPAHEVPDLDFQGDLDTATATGGPSRSGDAALLEFLVDKAQLLSAEQGQAARQLAHDEGLPLDAALVKEGGITEEALVSALTKECWVPHLKVDKYEIRKKALSTISLEDAKRFGVLPVDKLGSILNLAMVNPLDEEAIRHLESKTGLEIKKVVASRSEIDGGIARYYGGDGGAQAVLDSAGDGSRVFSQDLPANAQSPTQQMAKAAPPAAPAAAPAPAGPDGIDTMDDFMDIADIDDLLGDGDEVAPALIEPVALEPLAEESAAQPAAHSGPTSDDIFQDLTATAAADEPTVQAPSEEVLDLEFQPEPPAPAAPAAEPGFFDELGELEPLPSAAAPTPSPAPSPAPDHPAAAGTGSKSRSPSRAATKSFMAKPRSSSSVPSESVEDLLPVTEDEFQQSIAHGRVRIFEKWVGIQTRNRILNAVAVDEQLDPLLAGLEESAYQVPA